MAGRASPLPADLISPRLRLLVADIRAEWAGSDRRIAVFDHEFAASGRADDAAGASSNDPGIGPVNATALVAAISDVSAFARARDLAAWLCLGPKQTTVKSDVAGWQPGSVRAIA